MYKPQQLKALPEQERVDNLIAACDKVEDNASYTKVYTEEEMTDFRADFANKAIKLKMEKDETADEIKVLKNHIKELEKENNALLNILQAGREFSTGTLYWFFDHDTNTAVAFDKSGSIVTERKLRPEERQIKLKLAANG